MKIFKNEKNVLFKKNYLVSRIFHNFILKSKYSSKKQ